MLGLSWMSSRYIRAARISYNSGNYLSSRRKSKIAHIIAPSRNSFDLVVRSNLRLKKYSEAKKYFNRAELKGYRLLDHDQNRFSQN